MNKNKDITEDKSMEMADRKEWRLRYVSWNFSATIPLLEKIVGKPVWYDYKSGYAIIPMRGE